MLMEPDQMLMTEKSPLFIFITTVAGQKRSGSLCLWQCLSTFIIVQSHDRQSMYLERLNSLHDRGSTGHQVLHDEASLPLLECALNGLLGAIVLHLHRQW